VLALLVLKAILILPRPVGIAEILVHQVPDKNFARPPAPLDLLAVAQMLPDKAEIPVDCNIDSSFSLLKNE
jgi:hypothetical protein